MFKLRRNKKGFTLIELIVVIAILAILAAVAIPSFIGISKSAEDQVTLSNARNIAMAINTYNTLHPETADQISTTSGAKAKLTGESVEYDLWPKDLGTDEETAALAQITITGGVATVGDSVVEASAAASS